MVHKSSSLARTERPNLQDSSVAASHPFPTKDKESRGSIPSASPLGWRSLELVSSIRNPARRQSRAWLASFGIDSAASKVTNGSVLLKTHLWHCLRRPFIVYWSGLVQCTSAEDEKLNSAGQVFVLDVFNDQRQNSWVEWRPISSHADCRVGSAIRDLVVIPQHDGDGLEQE